MARIRFPGGEVVRTRQLEPTIKIKSTGFFSLNKASSLCLEPPCRVEVVFDDEVQTLSLEKNDQGKLKVEKVNRGSGGKITSKALYNWLRQLAVKEGKYRGKWNDKSKILTFKVEVESETDVERQLS